MQSIKSHVSLYVADKTEQCLPSVGFFTNSVSVLSPPLPSGDRFFYFLHSHHLTAFLDSTLLILGIASLLASVVVLCYRPKLVWNSFISELLFLLFFLSSHSFPAVWCLHCFLTMEKLRDAEASTSNRSMLMLPILYFFFLHLFRPNYQPRPRNSPDQVTVKPCWFIPQWKHRFRL